MQSYPNFPPGFPVVGQVIKVVVHRPVPVEALVLSRETRCGSHDFQVSVCMNKKIYVLVYNEERNSWCYFEPRETREPREAKVSIGE